jgi:glutathione S-transferase
LSLAKVVLNCDMLENLRTTMALKLKITYFDISGRAEPVRWALHIGGIEFEDHRVSFPQWAEIKSSTPFGACPVLEVDGVVFSQSGAQLRYAGKLAGLYPACNLAALKVDEIVDILEDFAVALTPSFKEQDPEKKLALRKDLAEKYFPDVFPKFEKVLERNGSSPYATGADLTIADLKLANFFNWFKLGVLDGIPADIADSYPRIVAARDAVNNHPKVVEWVNAHKKA